MDVIKKYKKGESFTAGRLRNCMNCGKRMRRHITTFNYAFCGKRCEIFYAIKLKRKHLEEKPLAYEKVIDKDGNEDVALREGAIKKREPKNGKFKKRWYIMFGH